MLMVFLCTCPPFLSSLDFFVSWIVTDTRIEMLEGQIEAHLGTLVDEQAQHMLRASGMLEIIGNLQQWEALRTQQGELSKFSGMAPEDLRAAAFHFDEFLSAANFSLLPQGDFLLSTRARLTVQTRATELVLDAYRRLYDSVNDLASGYEAPLTILKRSPVQVAQLFK